MFQKQLIKEDYLTLHNESVEKWEPGKLLFPKSELLIKYFQSGLYMDIVKKTWHQTKYELLDLKPKRS